jgi:YHS domain-containing protein
MANLGDSSRALKHAATDPVCSMEVIPGQTRLLAIYRGQTYWFCSKDCRTAFEMNPRKYLDADGARRQGWFKRYLGRIPKRNKEEFGTMGFKSH